MTRLLRPFALLLAVAFVFAGCQDNLTAPSPDASSSSPNASARGPGGGSGGPPSSSGPSCDLRVDDDGTADYNAIQAAIDNASAGNVICVEPGSYSGTVTVDVEDVTLQSTEHRGAVISGADSDTGPAVSIAANGVTLNGFEVTNPDKLLGVKVGAGISGVTVKYNVVTDVGPFTRLGTTGIIAAGGNSDLVITKNTVQNISSAFPDDESGYPTTNGIFLDDEVQSDYMNVSITDNVVQNLAAETAPLGILLQGDLADVNVVGNTVQGLVASNDRTPAEQEGTKFVTYAQGINSSASTTQNVRIAENVLRDITAEYFNGESIKIDGGTAGLTMEFNDLLAEVGIGNATTVEAAATCNYWGHPKGPRAVDGNRVADDGPNRQDRSAYFGPAEVSPWSVRSIENGQNHQNSCVGGRGAGNGNNGAPGR